MNRDEKVAVAITSLCLVPAVFAAADYIKIARAERAKRKKIDTWERESLNLIKDTHNRSIKKINDRDVPLEEALDYMVEQDKFVHQIIEDHRPVL